MVLFGDLFPSLIIFYSILVCVEGLRFFAEDVEISRTTDIVPYFIAKNVSSVLECVGKCVELDFCNSALFNVGERTCAISYGSSVLCYKQTTRVSEWTSTGFTLIHCTECDRLIRKKKTG